MFKLEGVVKFIGEQVQVSEKFRKVDFVVTDTSSMYPQDILFQLTQDKADLVNSFIEGQTVEVSFNLRGREWTSPQGEVKYFNTLEAWRIDAVGGSVPSAPAATNTAAPAAEVGADDDLPF
jgi:hypothetical protein